MMRILTPEAMSEVDRLSIEELGVPGLVLMENAAIGVADAIGDSFPEAQSVAILCGPGNNGGDGMAVGRQLAARRYRVKLLLVFGGRTPVGDAATQLKICRNQGLPMVEVGAGEKIDGVVEECSRSDLIVDALLGTGLKRPLEGQLAKISDATNALACPVVAVDIPSGLDGGITRFIGPRFEADLTVTFGAPKVAHVFPPASDAVGEVVVADLGIPPELIEAAAGNLHLLVGEEMSRQLIPRCDDCHKGDLGHLLILAGSKGKSGAAILAARAAMRVGSGLVTIGVPEPLLATVELGSLESMTLPLPPTAKGGLAVGGLDMLIAAMASKQALAIGPGLGLEGETVETVVGLVAESVLPLVLDADGLNAFAGDPGRIAERRGETILTPHEGELARLLGISVTQVRDERIAKAHEAAALCRSIVVLKGSRSLIVTPEGETYVNPTGNSGMASGGMGDVLTGMLGGFLAQGYDPLTAAQAGVYLHGLAGDFAARKIGVESLIATDLLQALPGAFRELASA